MKPKQLVTACLLGLFPSLLHAQTDSIAAGDRIELEQLQDASLPKLNFIKTNVTSILLKNYSIQYERVLKKKMSVALSFRVMPESGLPFKSTIRSLIGDDDDTKDMLEKFRMSNFAITPEVKFYLSKKGYGNGFYISLFYRYARYASNQLPVDFTYDDDTEGTLSLSGKLTTNTGGFLLGVQQMLGKTVCLDIWILGPHAGGGNGKFTGTSDRTLTQSEQDDLRESLEDIDLPLTNASATTNANGGTLKLSGPWAGVRAGLSLGIRF